MGYELINRVVFKKDGIYANTHSNNDNANFHSVRFCDDLERFFEILIDNCALRGKHKSILPFLYAFEKWDTDGREREQNLFLDAEYDKLTEADKLTQFTRARTPAMQSYLTAEKEAKKIKAQTLMRYFIEYAQENKNALRGRHGKINAR